VIPLAQVAENVPATEFKVWLVTCHEKPAQLLAAAIPLSGEDHVPSIEGSVGVGVLAEEAVLGASIDEFCSTPAHALVAAAVAALTYAPALDNEYALDDHVETSVDRAQAPFSSLFEAGSPIPQQPVLR